MDSSRSKGKDLSVGDLVTHILYGREWVGIILDFTECAVGSAEKVREMALVQMQPGTKHESFFQKHVSKKNRKTSSCGFVSANWLFKIKEKDEQ